CSVRGAREATGVNDDSLVVADQAHDHDTLDAGFLELGAGIIHVRVTIAYHHVCGDTARTPAREIVRQIDFGIALLRLIAGDNQRRDALTDRIDPLRVRGLPGRGECGASTCAQAESRAENQTAQRLRQACLPFEWIGETDSRLYVVRGASIT